MMEVMTGDVVFNLVNMLREGNPNATACIVEGGDDKKLFKAMFDSGRCSFVIAGGWAHALAGLKKAEAKGVRGVLAIVDADFARLEGEAPISTNHLWSDFRDLEVDMLTTDAFDRVVEELCDHDAVPHPPPGELRDRLFLAARPLAYFRLHNYRAKLALTFSGITYSKFVCLDTLAIDHEALVRVVKNKSQRPDLPDEDLLEVIRSLVDEAHDSRLLCRGHDVTMLMSLGLRRLFARYDAKHHDEIAPEVIEAKLRTAYSLSHFQRTGLYASIKAWEARNTPYRVLRDV
jgi:hypothetical protein